MNDLVAAANQIAHERGGVLVVDTKPRSGAGDDVAFAAGCLRFAGDEGFTSRLIIEFGDEPKVEVLIKKADLLLLIQPEDDARRERELFVTLYDAVLDGVPAQIAGAKDAITTFWRDKR